MAKTDIVVPAQAGARYRVEGPGPPVRPLSQAECQRQAADRCGRGDRRELSGFIWAIGQAVKPAAP